MDRFDCIWIFLLRDQGGSFYAFGLILYSSHLALIEKPMIVLYFV